MPIPEPDETFTEPLILLLDELTPDQRKRLADLLIQAAHYGRELTARAVSQATFSELLLGRMQIRREDAALKDQILAALERVREDNGHIGHLFSTLQGSVTDHTKPSDRRELKE